ncbi:MAG: flagellar hook-basal body complex protein FliE [Candidatus Polarisedimenticolaceae bacterium]|nr:flagellar hook-basal body complex protein FliE [Candidatus Polarisedimenticolaceae bacterium]
MSNMGINQVLAQMRTVTTQMQGASTLPASEKSVPGADFGQMLKNSIENVNELQKNSAAMSRSFELGEDNVDLAQVMIASQKSNISFQAMVQVRNKLVDAYKDVMNMPI